ncbi:MAG: hypothetical protein V5A50_12615 [Thiohalorhabdus sp.]|uniref:hypothetical protein n=1 Tax=Thiohalorhabdus sp. TaxID=3094134 RepID=UPI002FC32020
MMKKQPSMEAAIGGAVLGLSLCGVGVAYGGPGDSYAETWTAERGSAYTEDTNVWVYTPEFAERFGMPEKWESTKLKGAVAAAWRVEWPGIRTVFPHKGKEVAKPESYCFLDVYVPSSAKIQWLTDRVMDRRYLPPSSPAYLVPKTEKDKKRYEFETHEVGVPSSGGTVEFGTVDQDLGGFPIREYQRDLYPGITYIQFWKSCVTPPQIRSWVQIHAYENFFWGGAAWGVKSSDVHEVTHRIELPASFMRRLHKNWKERNREPARQGWGKVINE